MQTHLHGVSNHRLYWLTGRWRTQIPYKKVLIISNGSKQVFMTHMPCNIFHDPFMSLKIKQLISTENTHEITLNITQYLIHESKHIYLKDLLSINDLVLRSSVNIPQADLSVIRPTKQMPRLELTPRQTIPLRAVTSQPQIRITSSIKRWLRRMLAVIKHIHLRINRLGSNHKRVLRHVPSSVHLPFMVYLLDNLHLHTKVIDFNINSTQRNY